MSPVLSNHKPHKTGARLLTSQTGAVKQERAHLAEHSLQLVALRRIWDGRQDSRTLLPLVPCIPHCCLPPPNELLLQTQEGARLLEHALPLALCVRAPLPLRECQQAPCPRRRSARTDTRTQMRQETEIQIGREAARGRGGAIARTARCQLNVFITSRRRAGGTCVQLASLPQRVHPQRWRARG